MHGKLFALLVALSIILVASMPGVPPAGRTPERTAVVVIHPPPNTPGASATPSP